MLVAAGDAGAKAGAQTAAGADQAAASLSNLADVADDVANSAANLGANANQAATGLQNVTATGQGAAEIALDVSAAFADAASNMQGLDRIAFTLLTEQQQRFDEELAAVRASNEALDERAGILAQLRAQYTYLGDAQLQVLANEKLQQQQAEQRRRDQERREQEQRTNDGTQSQQQSGSSVVTRQIVVNNTYVLWDEASKRKAAIDFQKIQRNLQSLGG